VSALNHQRVAENHKKNYEIARAKAEREGRLDSFLLRSERLKKSYHKGESHKVTIPTRAVSKGIVARHCLYLRGDKFARRINELLAEAWKI
jgi:hypothetical protein